ncbi:hypothetical protein M2226_009265 [Bradyrhizobium elkanii]|nr:hypothetical protein [Bradyrhizobium elkanii]MCW2175528.1 hypothetical protein [Bradyrhizobium elkanii]
MLYQLIGQMREAYGGRDATSKWFEAASWILFSAINDPETAAYISKRCGDTTVEVDQLSQSSRKCRLSSRTRSKRLARGPLIMPHEVLRMRTDEQIIFTASNPPLRCGRHLVPTRRHAGVCRWKQVLPETRLRDLIDDRKMCPRPARGSSRACAETACGLRERRRWRRE